MKMAVTAQGPSIEAPIDPRFGRARFFVVVDSETGQLAPFDNEPNLNAVQGAGIQAARRVAQLGVEAVLTGHVGPKAFAALQAAGVRIYSGVTGTVRQAVEQYKAGQLSETHAATVEGHWT